MTEEPAAPASRRELRDFGLIVGGLFALIFGLAIPLLKHRAIPLWPWIVCIALVAPALFFPEALKFPQLAWTKLGLVLGWVNQRIILSIIFYVILVPTGLIMRICGRDPMARRFDPGAESYRVPARKPPPESMNRPF
ncbi:MAG: sxtJ [Candidatus Binataceae bacterium]|nr:sxtJ [Candidatus Binataceae bacterium]